MITRMAALTCVGMGLLILLATLIGSAQLIETLGYTHRNPDHFDLFVHDVSKNLFVNLTRTPDADEPEWDWSPDGQQFVYMYAVPGQAKICMLSQTLSCIEPQSTWDQKPKWSPDGERIAFLTLDGALVFYSVDSGVVERADTDGITMIDYNWSPDGTRIAAIGTPTESGATNVYLLDLETGTRQQITSDVRVIDLPQWSPNGTQLVFSVSGGIGQDIMLVDSASGEFHPLTDSGDTTDPFWSVDGKQVMYLRWTSDGWSSDGTTWTQYDLTTGETSLFMRHQPSLDSGTVWSSDGKHIGFISYNWRQFSVWVVDMEVASSRPVTFSYDEISELRWHP